MSTTSAPSHIVFETSELLSLICSYASRDTCCSILCTKKSGFLISSPFVWREVNGAINLLKLLPGIRIVYGTSKKMKEVVVPLLSEPNFTRFELYAAHIKSLEVYEKNKKSPFFEVSGWHTLSVKAAQGFLLPKLTSLTACAPTQLSAYHIQCLMWITTLVAPSLKSVRFISNGIDTYPRHSTLEGSIILEALTGVCPGLETLSIFPCNGSVKMSGESILLNLAAFNPFLRSLSALHNLSKLETGMAMVQQDTFLVLGQLPQLQQLSLVSASNESIEGPISLPEHLFSALRHLALEGLGPHEVGVILSQPPLVRNIDTLEVVVPLGEGEEIQVVEDFIPCLQKMTHLANLRAHFGEPGEDLDSEDIGVPSVLSILAKLPLRSLDLSGVFFGECIDFAYTFPSLIKLRVPGQTGCPKWLSALATIPKLEYLAVDVDLSDELVPSKDNILCQTLHTLESTTSLNLSCSPNWTNPAAEFLLEIFPNIKRVLTPKKLTPEGTMVEDQAVTWLKSQIDLHRELRILRARVANERGEK